MALAKLRRRAALVSRLFSAGADVRSRLKLLELRFRRRAEQGEPVQVRVKGLDGRAFELRPGMSDIYAFSDVFVHPFHLPPVEARDREMKAILELGTNIGVALSGLCHRYPNARLVGVEPDAENAALARRNTAAWSDRCTVVEGAAWDSDTELTIQGDWASGYEVRERRSGDPDRASRIKAWSVPTLLAEHFPDGDIDYVLMEIERSEQRILTQNNDWLGRVLSITVETYSSGDYGPADTVRDLTSLGFDARFESNEWGGFAVGTRPAG